jgi:hypothetical protein
LSAWLGVALGLWAAAPVDPLPPGGLSDEPPPEALASGSFEPPPPFQPGIVRLRLVAPAFLSLQQRGAQPLTTWAPGWAVAHPTGLICQAPCNLIIDARSDPELRFSGSFHYSDVFSLAGKQGDWVATVHPDDPAMSNAAIVLMVIGTMLVSGTPLLLLNAGISTGTVLAAAGFAGVGLASLGVGTLLWVANPLTFELTPGP